eukprot:CAMPEP_0170182628 /NCGR_PEP_ID=MMETSP0040_2-20121228/28407_1 /TAXON_ID=641309 /ORGANISM="Lotharella oceanica, Strain CCMP622" /LENGTH=364 /DNA_ID=CAMNT_0010428113 /DNA_START=42 /DNA_END=1136 /DNA_ORIENTATION=+
MKPDFQALVKEVADWKHLPEPSPSKKTKVMPTQNNGSAKATISPKDILFTMDSVTAVSPRGKWKLVMSKSGSFVMTLKDKCVVVEKNSVIRTVIVAHNNGREDYVAICINEPVQVGKSKYPIILFKFPRKSKQHLEWSTVKDEENDSYLSSLKDKVPLEALGTRWQGVPVERPSKEIFFTSDSKHAISCTVKANSGLLYPMKGGILYIGKPLLFLPRKDIEEIKAARGGSAIGQYFDLHVEHNDNLYEFSMINKREQQPIQDYVVKLASLRKKDARKSSAPDENANVEDDDDDDDDDDSDFAADEEENFCPDDFESDEEKLQQLDKDYNSEAEDEDEDDESAEAPVSVPEVPPKLEKGSDTDSA